jgi:hypothetical protein
MEYCSFIYVKTSSALLILVTFCSLPLVMRHIRHIMWKLIVVTRL